MFWVVCLTNAVVWYRYCSYGDDFESDSDDGNDNDDGDVLSQSKRLSMSKVAATNLTATPEFISLSQKLRGVPKEKARQLRVAIGAAGQRTGASRVVDLTNLRLLLSAQVPGLSKQDWQTLEAAFASPEKSKRTIDCDALCAYIGPE